MARNFETTHDFIARICTLDVDAAGDATVKFTERLNVEDAVQFAFRAGAAWDADRTTRRLLEMAGGKHGAD